ncbi:hypothetical protein AKAW_10916 [Aspergillus luchuensis IFO 4308]|nr:hypothetical protein ALUC_51196A [Aspergillus luchuensis]GAA92803.1 hypothetical protein AKAW_10916 [Aspergillus luchuensis IFO 4308]
MRKIRCIPNEKGGGVDACRRCAKLGYTCTVNGSLQSTTNEKSPEKQVVKASTHEGDDVVSGLFRNQPKTEEEDEVMQLRQLHRGVLQGRGLGEGYPSTLIDPNISVGDAVDCNSRSSKISLNMEEAEQLLLQFRQQRAYFPFIDVLEGTTAASMASSQPFLLLAILTVSLTRKPLLQKRLDERFRRVLSERVICYGAKSMDYVQGLLVYMAWRPLHIRPLSRQGSQFMQILVTMISDLKLTEKMHDQAARDICLGCFSLSSLLSVGFRRRGDDIAYKYLKQAVDAKQRLNQPYDEQFQLSKLHVLFEKTVRCHIECGPLKCSITKQRKVEEKMESLRLELQIFERVHGPSTTSDICFLSLASMSPIWTDFQIKTRSGMLIYLESLSHRMSRLSVTKAGETPDVFFMFKSVLDIVLSTYAPTSGDSSSLTSTSRRGNALEREETGRDVAATSSTPLTRCPMVNGSIRESEFWEAMKQSDVYLEGLTSGVNGEDVYKSGVDSLLADCGDWPSIFSEWVNVSVN